MQRIDKRPKTDVRDAARTSGGNIAQEMTNDTLRKIVGFDLVIDSQLPETGRESPVTADNALDQAFVSQVV